MIWVGVVASVLFIVATCFQACKSIHDGHSHGISHGMIWLLLSGFFLMLIYISDQIGWDPVLILSHAAQLILWSVIAKFKYYPRKQKLRGKLGGLLRNLENGEK